MFGNEILRDNLRRIFAEHDPALSPDDPTTTLFKMRQAAARHYWLELPQLRRIVFMMIVTIAALATSVAFHLHKEQLACWGYNVDALTAVVDTSVQLVLAGIILANEAVMQNWRNKRDAALLDAEIVFADSQEASAKATTNTQAPPTPDVPPPAANVSAPTDQTVDGTDKGAGD